MPKTHTCGRCGYETNQATHMRRHLWAANDCRPVDPEHAVDTATLRRDFEANVRPRSKKNKPVAPTTTVIHQTNNIYNTYNLNHPKFIIHNHLARLERDGVSLNSFGQEDSDHLPVGPSFCEEISDLMDYLDFQHYNTDVPQNQNLIVTSLRSGHARVWDAGTDTFETVDSSVALQDAFERYAARLESAGARHRLASRQHREDLALAGHLERSRNDGVPLEKEAARKLKKMMEEARLHAYNRTQQMARELQVA